jgi:NAD(P)-dependent dehydrogenase (short-subunit alcohol dehydrogenase family)
VISLSSGAALRGSPLSGGYVGAKAAIGRLTGYAAEESERAGLGIRFVSLLPQLTPATGLGVRYVAAFAARQGGPAGSPLTPDLAGQGRHGAGRRPWLPGARLRADRRGPSAADLTSCSIARRGQYS